MARDPRVDAYIESRAPFAQPILTWLRERVHAAVPGVDESIKWGVPAFVHAGRPLANMAAFKAHATFGFWNREVSAATGKEGDAMGQFGRVATLADLPDAAAFEALAREAAALIDAGVKPQRKREPKPDIVVPEELVEALARDPQAAATFDAFPPGCRREYSEWIAEAKRPETKARRVAEAVAWMREGKRRNWKYESC